MVSYITLSVANVTDEKAFIHQSTSHPSVLVGFWFGHGMKEEAVRSGLVFEAIKIHSLFISPSDRQAEELRSYTFITSLTECWN